MEDKVGGRRCRTNALDKASTESSGPLFGWSLHAIRTTVRLRSENDRPTSKHIARSRNGAIEFDHGPDSCTRIQLSNSEFKHEVPHALQGEVSRLLRPAMGCILIDMDHKSYKKRRPTAAP